MAPSRPQTYQKGGGAGEVLRRIVLRPCKCLVVVLGRSGFSEHLSFKMSFIDAALLNSICSKYCAARFVRVYNAHSLFYTAYNFEFLRHRILMFYGI